MLVVDSSVILAVVLPDEESDYADTVLRQMEEGSVVAYVPTLFHLETANVLAMAQRRQRLKSEEVLQGMKVIGLLPLLVDTEASFPSTVERIATLMTSYRLTAYDACYLELAVRRRFSLATLDQPLRAAAGREGACYQP